MRALKLIQLIALLLGGHVSFAGMLPKDDGYRGIWYANQPTKDEYKFKYSGGMATYPQQHIPIAIYCKKVNKTFFCYGGTTARDAKGKQQLLHMVSCFDHATRTVPRPTILLNKHTDDAHDNPTMSIDDDGFIWIFSSSHGTSRPSYISKSKQPYSVDEFERVLETNFSYTQPWHVPGKGFLFLHTRYAEGRNLFWMTSKKGMMWSTPQKLAKIEMGDYQISWREGERIATAFDFHPSPLGLNARANIYYLETRDFGQTWQTVHGKSVSLPLTTTNNPALIYDSRQDRQLVYLKDINFDARGKPVILFLKSKGFEPGPENGPRLWQTARWTGQEWLFRDFTTSQNNYDHGSLYIEADGTWRVTAPTEPGPQRYNPGGETVMWTSRDEASRGRKSNNSRATANAITPTRAGLLMRIRIFTRCGPTAMRASLPSRFFISRTRREITSGVCLRRWTPNWPNRKSLGECSKNSTRSVTGRIATTDSDEN